MAILKLEDLRSAIQARGYNWQANELPDNYGGLNRSVQHHLI
jgi:hypothetical protein